MKNLLWPVAMILGVIACSSSTTPAPSGDGGTGGTPTSTSPTGTSTGPGLGNCGTCQYEPTRADDCTKQGLPGNSCDCKTGQSISGTCPANPANPAKFCCPSSGK